MFTTKLNLSNEKFEQNSESTHVQSGTTRINGFFEILSGSSFILKDNAGEGKALVSTLEGKGEWRHIAVTDNFVKIGLTGSSDYLNENYFFQNTLHHIRPKINENKIWIGNSENIAVEAKLSGSSGIELSKDKDTIIFSFKNFFIKKVIGVKLNKTLNDFIPAGYRISSITLQETEGKNCGVLSIGTSLNSSNIVSEIPINKGADIILSLIESYFSSVKDTSIFITLDNLEGGNIILNFALMAVQ